MEPKFNLKDRVKVTCGAHADKTGVIISIHNDLDILPVYMIVYDKSRNKGMFRESQLAVVI